MPVKSQPFKFLQLPVFIGQETFLIKVDQRQQCRACLMRPKRHRWRSVPSSGSSASGFSLRIRCLPGWFSHVMKLIGGWGGSSLITLALLAVGLWGSSQCREVPPPFAGPTRVSSDLCHPSPGSTSLPWNPDHRQPWAGRRLAGYFFDKALEKTLAVPARVSSGLPGPSFALTFIIDLPLPDIAHAWKKAFPLRLIRNIPPPANPAQTKHRKRLCQ